MGAVFRAEGGGESARGCELMEWKDSCELLGSTRDDKRSLMVEFLPL